MATGAEHAQGSAARMQSGGGAARTSLRNPSSQKYKVQLLRITSTAEGAGQKGAVKRHGLPPYAFSVEASDCRRVQSLGGRAGELAASGRRPAAAPDLVTSDSSFINHPRCSQQPRHASRDTTQAANTAGRAAKHASRRHHDRKSLVVTGGGGSEKEKKKHPVVEIVYSNNKQPIIQQRHLVIDEYTKITVSNLSSLKRFL